MSIDTEAIARTAARGFPLPARSEKREDFASLQTGALEALFSRRGATPPEGEGVLSFASNLEGAFSTVVISNDSGAWYYAGKGISELVAKLKSPQRLSDAQEQLLSYVVEGGDSWKVKPTKRAQENARRILAALEEKNLFPQRIARAQDGGIGITYLRGGLRAYVECLNDGETWASHMGASELPVVTELEEMGHGFATFIEGIRAHLRPFTLRHRMRSPTDNAP